MGRGYGDEVHQKPKFVRNDLFQGSHNLGSKTGDDQDQETQARLTHRH